MTLEATSAGTGVRAMDRLVRLQRLTADLASATAPARIAEVVVDHILAEVGAATAAIWLVENDDRIGMIRSSGFSDAAVALTGSMAISPTFPLGDALVRGEPILLRGRDEYAEKYPQSAARSSSLGGPTGAIACLPLLLGDRRLGAITYAFDEERIFSADERTYFDVVAAHVVQALDRARLFEAERAARTRVELLYAIADAGSRATTLDELLQPALEHVCRALSVERASILLFDDQSTMRFRAWRGLSDEYRAAVDGHSPWKSDAREPQPIPVDDVLTDDAMTPYRETFAKEGIRALAFVPLVDERRLIGKFMIYCADPRRFTVDDMRLATAIATQLAEAAARRSAEDAMRQAAHARAELLAVVAHDLRNPLGVAQLKAQMMLRKMPDAKKDLDVILRGTQHMSRLIGDLLDAASIEAGRIVVEKSSHPVTDIVNESLDLLRPLAEQKSLRLSSLVDPSDLVASCDRPRVIQVLTNIVGNAIKFTPTMGSIDVGASRDGGVVRVQVSDTGAGIPAAERERMFERYVHGRQKGSVGLGLFIARGLVNAHGGRTWIESVNPDGSGTRVCFTLPAG